MPVPYFCVTFTVPQEVRFALRAGSPGGRCRVNASEPDDACSDMPLPLVADAKQQRAEGRQAAAYRILFEAADEALRSVAANTRVLRGTELGYFGDYGG